MPQPYVPREGANLETGHRILERRPECAVKIATVAAAWAEVEFHLAMLLGHATTAEFRVDPDGPIVYSETNPISMAAMGALESLSARLDVIEAVLAVSTPQHLRDRFAAMKKPIRQAVGMRNGVLHTRWYITDSYPSDILAVVSDRPERSFVRYTPKDLDVIIDRIFDVRREVSEFGVTCLAHMFEGRRRAPPPPPPEPLKG